MKKNPRMRPVFALPTSLLAALLGAFLFCASCPSDPDPIIKGIEIGEKVFSPNAQRLMNYLDDNYGQKIISGQMDAAWANNKGDNNTGLDMIARVYADVSKYPAIKGFDFIDLPNSWGGYGQNQINEAIEWWDGKNNGTKLLPTDKADIHGIVTFCWHWKPNNTDFRVNGTTFRIPWKGGKLDTESADFATIKSDLDKVAARLQLLKNKDIPVLWRPLHEAAGDANYPNSGGWFWWGASDVSSPAQRYIALWEYMYVYLAETKGLTNLIWVWNGQDRDWFPNPKSVDIVGYDHYTNANTTALAQDYTGQQWKNRFNQTKNMIPSGNSFMVALTENGAIPDPDNCFKDNTMWSWFCTWNDDNTGAGVTGKNNFWTGEYHNTSAHKTLVYNHEKVITLDELPDLTAYRLE